MAKKATAESIEEGTEQAFNPAQPPAWVSVGPDGTGGSVMKYHEAIKFLRSTNLPLTEAAVFDLYANKYKGKVIGDGPQ